MACRRRPPPLADLLDASNAVADGGLSEGVRNRGSEASRRAARDGLVGLALELESRGCRGAGLGGGLLNRTSDRSQRDAHAPIFGIPGLARQTEERVLLARPRGLA